MTCFARSGGTVLNQCIGSMPGIVMLSEVNPLGGGWSEAEGTESCTTVQEQAANWYGISVRAPSFKYGIQEIASVCEKTGRHLVVRDWSFINFIPHFYNGYNPPKRLLTLEITGEELDVKPFAFVRDAIDVWISRGTPPPGDFFPHYLDYVRAVLDTGQPVFRYEDFCLNPGAVLRAICKETGIEYDEGWRNYKSYENVNGDVQTPGGSRGMRQDSISPLPRRPIPEHKIGALHGCREMMEANRLLGYPESYEGKDSGNTSKPDTLGGRGPVESSPPRTDCDIRPADAGDPRNPEASSVELRIAGGATTHQPRKAAHDRLRTALAAAASSNRLAARFTARDEESTPARSHLHVMKDRSHLEESNRTPTPRPAQYSEVPLRCDCQDQPFSQNAASLLMRDLTAAPRTESQTSSDGASAPADRLDALSLGGTASDTVGNRHDHRQEATRTPAATASATELDLSRMRRAASELKSASASQFSLNEIHNFNQRERDRWVAAMASSIRSGSRVLDVGAGTCPYRQLFAHCDYRTHDFKQYKGEKLGGTSEYGEIDYVSDIVDIPVPDASFDVLLCTEVFEHVPEPIRALEEMARIVKPGGRLLITAPLGSGLHQLPYHYYGGYTPYWYEHFAAKFGLEIREITPNGGFFRLLAQECNRFAWTYRQNAHLHGANSAEMFNFFSDVLPRYLFSLEERHFMDQFTVGYHVEMAKPTHTPAEDHEDDMDLLDAVWAQDDRLDAAGATPNRHTRSSSASGPSRVSAFDLRTSDHKAAADDDISIEEMRNSLLDALARGSGATDNLALLAQAAVEVGDYDTARRCLESILIIDDSHVRARSMLNQISTHSGL